MGKLQITNQLVADLQCRVLHIAVSISSFIATTIPSWDRRFWISTPNPKMSHEFFLLPQRKALPFSCTVLVSIIIFVLLSRMSVTVWWSFPYQGTFQTQLTNTNAACLTFFFVFNTRENLLVSQIYWQLVKDQLKIDFFFFSFHLSVFNRSVVWIRLDQLFWLLL